MSTLTDLDWIAFASILVLTLAAVLYGNRKKKTPRALDYLLMGRKLSLPLFVATLVATWYGGLFGVTAIAFEHGIYNLLIQGGFWYLSYLIFAFFLVRKARQSKAKTLPELVGQQFGPNSARIAAVFNFFNVVPIVYVISLGLFIQTLTGLDTPSASALGTLFVLGYSLFGGFRAIVFSDLVQFFVMCFGVLCVLVLSVQTHGGLSFLTQNLPQAHFSLTSQPLGTTLAWGLIALSTLVDPNFYHRCFAAGSDSIARRGIYISTAVWFCFDICTTLGAMYARTQLPDAQPGAAYLTYALDLLPSGLRGVVLGGILATILSTLDSYLFLAGTTLSHDLAPRKWIRSTRLHRIGITLTAILALALSLSFQGAIKSVWKTLGSYSAACLLFPVLIGFIFPKQISDRLFVLASLSGVVVTTAWRLAPPVHLDEIYPGAVATALVIGLGKLLDIKKTRRS